MTRLPHHLLAGHSVSILLLSALVFGQSKSPQNQDRPFYYHGGQKVFLTPTPSTLAAKVHAGVSIPDRFPKLTQYFHSIAPSAMGSEREIIVSNASVPQGKAAAAISPAEASREITSVPVYHYGKLTLVLQNEVLVNFKPSASITDRESLLKKFSSSFKELVPGSGAYAVSLGNPAATLEVSNVLHGNRDVLSAEPNFLVLSTPDKKATKRWVAPEMPPASGGPLTPTYPQDQFFNRQWSLENRIDQSAYGKEKADIRVRGAWDVTKGTEQVRVAILDDGVDINHPDLQDQLIRDNEQVVAWDVIADSPIQQRAASDTHGTHVAGVIAARTNNVIGVAGIAPGVKIVPIRMGSTTVKNWTNAGLFFKAVYKAVELHADVINASFFFPPSDIADSAVAYGLKEGRNGKGLIMVFAAGNGGSILYPAKLALTMPVLAVGATNSWDQVKTTSSNDGDVTWSSSAGPEVTVVAPGIGIVTTEATSAKGDAGGKYIFDFFGTSSAAPQVAGIAALLLSLPSYHEALAEEVRQQIIRTTDKIEGPNRTNRAGWGRVNACRALGGTQCD
jgi:subtilisin family serine protease